MGEKKPILDDDKDVEIYGDKKFPLDTHGLTLTTEPVCNKGRLCRVIWLVKGTK